MKTISAIALALFVAARSHAGIICQQSPNAGSSGYLSSTTANAGSKLEEFVWDSFSTATTQTLREIQWIGTRSGPAPVDFQISINTIAILGGTVWHTNGAASETPTTTPSTGYVFTNWTLGGAPAGSTNPVTFTANAYYAFTANFTAAPMLSITPPAPGDGFGFSWPSSLTGWVLQESPDLSPASWVNSALSITTSGGQNQVSVPNPTGNLFFRLAHP